MFSYWTSYYSQSSTNAWPPLYNSLFFVPMDSKKFIHWLLFKASLQLPPLYNGYFCPQGARCREVQLYITLGLVKHPLKYGATCHGWIFCFLSHVTRSSTQFSITFSWFSIFDSCRNRESSRELRLTTDCQLTFERYSMVHVQRFGWFLVKTFTPA